MKIFSTRPALAATLAFAIGGQLASQATAQSDSEQKPVAVIAASSYSELLADIDYLGELGGRPAAGQQIEGMLALFTQGKGLQGLEKEKPWGAVVMTDGFQFNPIVCLPVSDLDALLRLIEGFGMATSDVGDGITEIESPNQSIYVKKTGGWAFVAQKPELLTETPADPTALFKSLTDEYDLGVRVMLQNIPEMYRQIAIQQMQAGAEQGMERMAEESDEAYEIRRKGVEANIDQISQMMQEFDEITLGLNVDSEEGNAYIDFVYSALPESQSAKALAAYRAATTNFAGCMNEEAAIRWNLSVDTPPELLEQQREQLQAQMLSLRQQAMNAIDQEASLPNDEVRETLKEAANELLDALEATTMSGHFDVAGHVDLSSTMLSVIAGGFAKETGKIESAAKKVAALLEGEPDFPGVEWNADSHQGAAIHTMSIPLPPEAPEEAREMFGESLDLALGLGDEVVYFAAGKDCVDQLKEAINKSQSAGSVAVQPMQLTLAVGPILKMGTELNNDNLVVAAMAEALLTSEGYDEIHVTVESVGEKLRIRLELESGLLKAIGAAAAEARNAGVGAGF